MFIEKSEYHSYSAQVLLLIDLEMLHAPGLQKIDRTTNLEGILVLILPHALPLNPL